MTSSLLKLAEGLDLLATAGRAALTETDEVVVANRVNAADTRTVAELCKDAGCRLGVQDGSFTEWSADIGAVEDGLGPFRLTIEKPGGRSVSTILLTLSGLEDGLRSAASGSVLRPVRSMAAFDTYRLRVCPVADMTVFEPKLLVARPRKMVRETGDRRRVPEDVGAWVLRDPEGALPAPGDVAFATWSALSTANLLLSFANEASVDTISLRGPPSVTLAMPVNGRSPVLPADSLRDLQRAATWVFENEREAEMRQGLFAAEMARAASGERDAVQAFARLSGSVLSSARIAYQLSLSQVSRDSLKALADLRKAVSDETGKLAESTRTLAGAVTTSVFAGLGLVLARLKADLPSGLVAAVGVVLAVYVGSVIASGLDFLNIQRQVRAEWRPRLYSFLEDGEYKKMVEQPIALAERAYGKAARRGGAVVAIMVVALLAFAGWETMQTPKAAAAPPALAGAQTGSQQQVQQLPAAPAAPIVTPAPAPVGTLPGPRAKLQAPAAPAHP